MIKVVGKRIYARFRGDRVPVSSIETIEQSPLEIKKIGPEGIVVKGRLMDIVDVSAKIKDS